MKNFGRYIINQDGVSIEQRRGTENIDLNDYLVLVQSPIEQVGQAFIQMGLVDLWERDVYAREIELTNKRSFILFQFQRHPWTIIQSSNFFPHTIWLKDEYALLTSIWLHTKAIYYQVSDVCGHTGYHLYNCGESTERLYFEAKDFEEEMDANSSMRENEYRSEEGIYQFRSQLRQIKAEDIQNVARNAYDFTNQFLREQDAYAPGISWISDFGVGQKVTVRVLGLERNDFERMDYIALI
ncbi:hypothetical protein WA1_21710 [Scytonema hofmannii PCC 7110]|uniref:Uncharacterized protein n=2 Tax=Scytonema TaxID=1203 RepID=A0A139X9F0_9CYAN|nr:hypothetical protein [Scytonema hofmannii]KYC41327.1 hypothetical protein WA1_21710 [Scytonema hofmannii PCC 7110]